MEINQIIDTIKKYIRILINEKIKYKNEVLLLAVTYRNQLDEEVLHQIPEIIYNLHNELLYLADIYKLLSKLYI